MSGIPMPARGEKKMARVFVLMLFVLGAMALAGPVQDPLAVAPAMYKKKFENDRARVMQVTFKPGQSIAWHSHPDHLVYVISGGSLSVFKPDGSSQALKLKTGEVLYLPAEKHRGRNTGKTTLRLLVTELK
jgi:quercetin dioxygenase-like cupin family protein